MTGFGRASRSYADKLISAEVRSLNSKFSDLRFRVPSNFKEREQEIRRTITNRTERGKIDAVVDVKALQGEDGYTINEPLFRKYFREIESLANELGIEKGDIVQTILRIPNVVAGEDREISEEEWEATMAVVNEALDQFDQFRLTEGAALESELRDRIGNIREQLVKVPPFETERMDRLRQRLRQNLDEFLGKENVDENRFEQEVLFYLEKMDITEEKVRLEQHCIFFLEQLDAQVMVKGRKLSFISQEMGREINTLGAKAYSADIQRLVVAMKDELEKIKEQVANIL
ncbi:MAG: YicC family protein [Saprospirales bacterium]|nr:YicC family protein [Saprospirales bacterium]